MQNYDAMLFREALKSGCYNLQKARDSYRELVGGDGKMHHDLVQQYAEVGWDTFVIHPNARSLALSQGAQILSSALWSLNLCDTLSPDPHDDVDMVSHV